MQRLLYQQRALEERIAELETTIGMLQDTLGSYISSKQVLEELATREAGEQMLINIGGAIFVEAKVVSNDKVVRGIGSGIRVEQSLEDAKTNISQRVEELTEYLSKLRQEYQTTVNQAAMVNQQAQQILAQAQAQARPKPPEE
ncbi:MAG: prefoldin subunit alpha [Candidatus Thorarchaeota archaeon]